MRHQFSFLGVAAPERNKLYKKILSRAKKNKDDRLGFCRYLLRKKKSREYPVCGCQLF